MFPLQRQRGRGWGGAHFSKSHTNATAHDDAPLPHAARHLAYAQEFGRSPAKQELEWPPAGYPSSRTVRRHFGSFTAGLRAAGLEPRGRQRWDAGAIATAMREFRREVGRWPRASDWQVACEDWPSASTVHNRFGSWKAALGAAGAA
jgi:hypothetical protein